MGVFSREISQFLKICPPPSFRSHLCSSPMGVFLRDYGICKRLLTNKSTGTTDIAFNLKRMDEFLEAIREGRAGM